MSTMRKLALAALSAIMLLSLFAASAAALRSIRSSEGTIQTRTTALTFEALGARAVCEVGMTIRLNANPIAKTARSNIGVANVKVVGQERRNAGEACVEGRGLALGGELAPPTSYNVNFLSFEGTLPEITGLRLQILRVAFQVTIAGQTCLVTANVLGTQRLNRTQELEVLTGEVGSNQFRLEEISVRRVAGLLCPEARAMSMRGSFTPERSARLTLV